MKKVIGIDLGTTNSVVSVLENGKPVVIANEEGYRTTPSVVAYKNNDVLVGASARRQAVTNPKNTVYSSKRFIGKTYEEVKAEMGKVPYEVIEKNGQVLFNVSGKTVTPQEVAAKVLLKLKTAAENYLGEKVTEAVITVPAYFTDSQRQATKDAGKIAGLDVKRIINEPTAAAIAYGMDKKTDQKVVVFDFGGGTFDVSVLDIGENIIEVLSTSGNNHLGGDDIDDLLMNEFIKTFKDESGIDISKDPMALQRLKEAAEKAKIELSSSQATDVNLPFLTADQAGPKHFNYSLTRAKFEQLIASIIKETIEPCKKALADAKLSVSQIDEILMVGGSTRIPLVTKSVEEFFGKEVNKGVNPDEVVAIGAAVQGGILTGEVKDLLLLDVTPLSLGIEVMGGIMQHLIERNTTIPHRKSEVFSTAENNQSAVTIRVLHGERKMAQDNKVLAEFNLEGIPAAPRGTPQIEVTFDIDANGILSVSAKDKATGKEQTVRVEAANKLSEAEIKKMVAEAEAHREEDEKKKSVVEKQNKLDSLIFSVENFLKENSDSELSAELENAKKVKVSSDANELDKSFSSLEKVMHAAANKVYQKAAQQQGQAQGGHPSQPDNGPKPGDDNVIDAEIV